MKPPSEVIFVKVGNGRLALYHRPGRGMFAHLRKLGCTHVVTLLKESEGAERIGGLAQAAGLEWIWLPVPNGNHPEGEVHDRMIQSLPQLSGLLDEGKSLLIHCSAGVHRTGTLAYGLLCWRGLGEKQALEIIRRTRPETAEGMGTKRMRWGNENAHAVRSWKPAWLEVIQRRIQNIFGMRKGRINS
jgi:protein-tyrosine phosphatase